MQSGEDRRSAHVMALARGDPSAARGIIEPSIELSATASISKLRDSPTARTHSARQRTVSAVSLSGSCSDAPGSGCKSSSSRLVAATRDPSVA